MAYFSALGGTGGTSATITVTYSEDFYGTTITATNGTTTLTKTATSSGTLTFDVSEGGTWVVSSTVEGATYSESVDVTFEYTTPQLIALPNGSTATPVNVIQTWLKCAMIRDKNYTTLSQVLNDTETFIALCADSNACDYMARSTNWASGVAADSTAMLIVGKYNYCANALLGNSTWASAIALSDYAENVFDISVPKMTSNTTPSGTVIAGQSMSNPAYYYFDRSTSNSPLCTSDSVTAWIGYDFTNSVPIKEVLISNVYRTRQFALSWSDDGSTWTDDTEWYETQSDDATLAIHSPEESAHRYWRIIRKSTDGALRGGFGSEAQFYGHTDHGYTGTVIHSAVEDTTYYVSGGSNVPFCTIASGDTETVLASTIESLKNQTITLYSSVAKDPDNLSNNYSKQIRITPNVTEIYLMPNKALYWWGSECGQTFTSKSVPSTTLLNTTATTNKNNKVLSITTSSSGTFASGYVTSDTKETTDATKLCCLASSASMYNYGGSNVISQCYYSGGSTYASGTQICYSAALTTLTKFETDITSVSSAQLGVMLQAYGASRTSQVTVNALWYE